MTAFLEKPNSSATSPAGTFSTPSRRHAFPAVADMSGCTAGHELLNYMLDMIPIPLANEMQDFSLIIAKPHRPGAQC